MKSDDSPSNLSWFLAVLLSRTRCHRFWLLCCLTHMCRIKCLIDAVKPSAHVTLGLRFPRPDLGDGRTFHVTTPPLITPLVSW